MIHIDHKEQCVGCGACRDVCPVGCIRLQADEEGFLYPQVNIDQCIHCDKCERACPVTNLSVTNKEIIGYAARTKDDTIRLESSSGGVFSEIAQYILNQGGVVFGAALAEDFSVEHVCVDTAEQLAKLRGSKYVQSRIGQTYRQAKQYLDAGKTVLFTGTPCQIAGLQRFLGKAYDNLYTQDIICHGVPSPAVWDRYVKFREKEAGAKTRSILFRNKANGWRNYTIRFAFENGAVYDESIADDPYMQSFLKDLCLRPSCYSCAFKSKQRCADLTLADFWGVEECHPGMDDDRGTSLVLLHSSKGKELFVQVQDRFTMEKTDLKKAIIFNAAMIKSAAYKPERSQFVKSVCEKGFESATRKYLKTSMILRVKRKMKKIFMKMRGKR